MKRIATPIETTELCNYGCGCTAQFKNGSGKLMCLERSNSCPAIRKKNSEGVAASGRDYVSDYKNLSQESKDKINHRKNKRYAIFGNPGSGNFKNSLLLSRGHRCESCTNTEWMGKPITLELEHVDADRVNNTEENLKLPCPNCHSQTSTWRRSSNQPGFRKKKHTDETIIEAITTSTSLNQVLSKLELRYGSVPTIVKVMVDYKVNFMGY